MFYFWWVPVVIATSSLGAWLSKLTNDHKSWSFVLFLYLMNFLGIWPWVAKCSTNLIFDGFLYDILLFLSYSLTLLLLGCGNSFTITQWVAFTMICVGMVLLKL